MKNSFVLPSCTYNIVLSKDDVEQLLKSGHITIRNSYVGEGRDLIHTDEHVPYHVQYINIGLDK